MTVYNYLLDFEPAKETRILYTSITSRYGWFPILQRHKPPYEIDQDHIYFTHNKTCYWDDIRYEALPSIHLADIDTLLHLATTCRLLRPEVLALTWSNADISVSSSNLSKALYSIFCNVLSSDACSCVRTLQLENHSSAPVREISKIIKLIRHRLPQLDQLVIHIPHNSGTLSYDRDQRFWCRSQSCSGWRCGACLLGSLSDFTTSSRLSATDTGRISFGCTTKP
jgi:hypothetical protein